jgi:hypothetical protein
VRAALRVGRRAVGVAWWRRGVGSGRHGGRRAPCEGE